MNCHRGIAIHIVWLGWRQVTHITKKLHAQCYSDHVNYISDHVNYMCYNVIGNFMDLLRYLQMARKKSSDDIIERTGICPWKDFLISQLLNNIFIELFVYMFTS